MTTDPAAETPALPIARAALWMSGALLSFLTMALGGRELANAGLGTFQILFFRSIVGLLLIGALVAAGRGRGLSTQRLGLHLWRNVAHFGGQFGWFFAIAAIPLAEVFAIEFTIPLWTALMAVAFLGERLTPLRMFALVLALAGVAMIVRPGAALVDVASLAALGGAIAYAVSHVLTKQLTRTEPPLTILFYMTLIQLPLGGIGALLQWRELAAGHLPWLVLVGLAAMSAHYCLARALALAEITFVLPMDFLRLPLVALIGYVLYGERIDAWAIAGTLLILGANLLNLPPRRRQAGDKLKR